MKLFLLFIGFFVFLFGLFFISSFSVFAAGNMGLLPYPLNPIPSIHIFPKRTSDLTGFVTKKLIPSKLTTSVTQHLVFPYVFDDGIPFTASFWNIPAGVSSAPSVSSPVLIRQDKRISFTWKNRSPGKGISQTRFYVQWMKSMAFSDGNYQFTIHAVGDVKLSLDDRLILTNRDMPTVEKTVVDKTVESGIHTILLEYYQNNSNGHIDFQIDKVANPGMSFTGEYFSNSALEGLPVISRQDDMINFYWGNIDPLYGSLSKYSVRWTRQQHFPSGSNTFSLSVSGGVRFWIDTMLLVDDWHDHGLMTYTPSLVLPEGMHTLKIEYFKGSESSSISLAQQ